MVFVPFALQGHIWAPCHAGYNTLEEAIGAAKFHLVNNPPKDVFEKAIVESATGHRLFTSKDCTVVEFYRTEQDQTFAVALYKILEGEIGTEPA